MKPFDKCIFAAALCTLLLAVTAVEARPLPGGYTVKSLRRMSDCELNRLFEQAPPGNITAGNARGHVLRMIDAKMPRVQACLTNVLWKGKQFEDDGSFINQWLGFQALRSRAEPGISWHDGKPCIIIEYPSNTPLFGNYHDELREIAPGLFLARLYERCPCTRFRGYFIIQMETCR